MALSYQHWNTQKKNWTAHNGYLCDLPVEEFLLVIGFQTFGIAEIGRSSGAIFAGVTIPYMQNL
jgi:hypothetical protein